MQESINDYYQAPIPVLYFSNPRHSHHSKKYNRSLDLSNKTRALYGASVLDKILEQGSSKPKKMIALREIKTLEPLSSLDDRTFHTPSKSDYTELCPNGNSSGLQERSRTFKENRRYASSPKKKGSNEPRVFSGPTIIEKSKKILERVRLPKDIFKEAYEKKKLSGDVPIGQNYPKEKMQKIAKKLDLVINVERQVWLDAEEKKYRFMKDIPQEYYHKLLEGRSTRRKETSPCSEQKKMPRIALNGSLITATLIPFSPAKNSASVASSETSTPGVSTERRLRFRPRIKIHGIELGGIQKNESFSPRLESVNSVKGSRRMNSLERTGEKSYRRDTVKYGRGDSVELWLTRTNQLTEEINKMKSANETSIEVIDSYRKKGDDIARALKKRIDQKVTLKSESDLCSSDKALVIREMEERAKNPKVGFVDKKSMGENKETTDFYKHLLYKRQKQAHKALMNALADKPRTSVTKEEGRNIFEAPSAS